MNEQIARFYPVPNQGQSLPPVNAGANAVRSIVVDLTTARTLQRIPIGGNFLWMVEASLSTASLTIAFSRENGTEGVPFRQGTAVKGVAFSEIFITNTAQAGVTVTLVYVTEASQALEVTNAGISIATVSLARSTTLVTTADVVATNGATTLIVAANSANRKVICTNLAAGAQTLRFGDSNAGATRGTPVEPGDSIVFETTAAIYAYNPGGSSQNVAVSIERD